MEAGSNARHIRKATMKVEQLSIFLENKAGRLAQVTKTLAEAGIEVSFLSWMVVGTPISWGSMLLSWFFMYKFVFKLSMKKDPALTQYVNDEYAKLGKMGKGELISAISLVVFIIMLCLTVIRN